MKYPALDVNGVEEDFLLALVDDFNPSAVEEHDSRITIFFPDAARRDRARDAVVLTYPDADIRAHEVDDEDWARRSQQNVTPVTVGRVTVLPPWAALPPHQDSPKRSTHEEAPPSSSNLAPPVRVVIAPSMGFGTGHHATTRLCLRALQEIDLSGAVVLDVGTGSGVLAIAARMLGAGDVVGIDVDGDAIQSAVENLAENPGADHVRFAVSDLRDGPLPNADVITANLTAALLVKSAGLLLTSMNRGGALAVSGLQRHERDEVIRAFGPAQLVWEASEDDWVAIIFRR